jgi:phage terminase Nu1 subunit (DNA packaging protein)
MTEIESTNQLIKKNDLAKLFGVSGRTVDSWVAKRMIPYLAISPRLHLFDPSAVKLALAAKFGVVSKDSGCL